MKIEVVPLTDFVHGRASFAEGKAIEIEEVDANDLERAGLVRVKMMPPLRNQMMPAHSTKSSETAAGKAPADGEGTPSASSRAARVSPPKIARPSVRGASSRRKADT